MNRIFILLALLFLQRTTFAQKTEFNLKSLPQPYATDYPHYEELYQKAWELAWSHITVKEGMTQSPFIDEAFCDYNDWIWDTQFMLLYWRYAAHLGDWILTNNNFYKPIHDGVSSSGAIHIPDNPPLFAWSEYLYNKISGDKEHLEQLLFKDRYLQKHYYWFDTIQPRSVICSSAPTCLKKVEKGYLWEGGRSGMDNTPRGRTYAPVKEERPNNPNMLWVDAIAQQALSADCIAQLLQESGKKEEAKFWQHKRDSIGKLINQYYWDAEDGFYYDIDRRDNKFLKVATPASYWVMLAGVAPKKNGERMAEKAESKEWFGADAPFTTLIESDPNFGTDGNYWRGAMWLPTSYMSIKALERYGYLRLAHEAAIRVIDRQYHTYKDYSPNTIWECYSPSEYKPSYRHDYKEYVRPDFCGWSALGPISLFIENVLGFYDIDANSRTIRWNRELQKPHGIRNLHFGDIVTDIEWDGKQVISKTNKPYTLIMNGKKIKIKPE
ncbi:MAG: trehalase family glycosidase [Bacteroidales bacterium]